MFRRHFHNMLSETGSSREKNIIKTLFQQLLHHIPFSIKHGDMTGFKNRRNNFLYNLRRCRGKRRRFQHGTIPGRDGTD